MNNYKILFSIPVHEKLEVVLDQLMNVFTLNPDSGVVLHLSPAFDYQNSKISLLQFNSILRQIGGDVIINPQSVRTGFFDIIQAHISNFKYASSVCEFEYFALLASNELFIKNGLIDYVKNYDSGVNDGIIPVTSKTRTGKSAHKDQVLHRILDDMNSKDIYWSQIEGSFYKSEIFNQMCKEIEKFFDYRTIGPNDLYAREEVYFPTVFWGLFKQQDNLSISTKGMFTYVPWGRLTLSVSLAEVIKYAEKSSNIFCVKRVARNLNDPIRIYIRQRFGYDKLISLPIKTGIPEPILKLQDFIREKIQVTQILKGLVKGKIQRMFSKSSK